MEDKVNISEEIKKVKIKDLPQTTSINDNDIFIESNTLETYKVTADDIAKYVSSNEHLVNKYLHIADVGVANGVAPLNENRKINGNYITYGTVKDTAYEGNKGKILETNIDNHITDNDAHGYNTKITSEINRATNMENYLSQSLTEEIARAKNEEANLDTKISDEIKRLENIDATLSQNITTEVNRAKAAEKVLSDNLSAEINRAKTAEGLKADKASPTFTGTPKAPTPVNGNNSTQIATTAFVQSAIGTAIAASDAMIMKGTIGTNGTVATLPSTYKTGWTYRVVAAGTYAGNVCEIGDLIIALTNRNGSGNVNTDWCVAQTNINGAITGIKTGDAYIQISQTGSTVTITHKDVAREDTTSSASPSHGGTFTAVKSVGSDSKGHITSVDTETVKLPIYGVATSSANGLMTSEMVTKLNGIADGSNQYVHPDTHPATMITQDATHRFSTDTEKSEWNDKLSPTGNGSNLTTTFTQSTTRTNLTTGEKLSALFGKIAKWFADLKTVAFTGNYADLTNKPTIPTVGNGTVTITQNGAIKGTFTMNQSENTTVALTGNNTIYGVATSSALGLIKSGTDITVDSSGNVSVNDDSHNHVISNVDGLQNILNGKANKSVLTNQDLNTVTTPGFYNAGGGNTVTNKPAGISHFGLIVIHRASGSYYTQIIFNDTSSYRRFCVNDTWGNWSQDKLTDTVYTHPTSSGNKHIPSGGSSGQILRWSADGTAIWGNDNNTTYSNFVKSGSGAKSGLVPAPPTTAGTTKYLREDETWAIPPNTKNTAGSTNTSSKLFLIGATSQAANPQTYSHDTAYIGTDGCLYSNSTRVINEVISSAEPTNQISGDYWLQDY